MSSTTPEAAAPRRGYVTFLATCLSESAPDAGRTSSQPHLHGELDALRQRLRSPRHRIAEVVGDAIQRIPLVWPLLARATDAVLRRERERIRQSTGRKP